MKITRNPNSMARLIPRSLPKPPAVPTRPDHFKPDPPESKEAGFRRVAFSMAAGAGVGTVAGAATGLLGALPGVPLGLATGLTASAGLLTGAWLGLAIGYVGC